MLIPLSDPIWARLYGPYGIKNVASILSDLEQVWDTATAEDLYWEKLHHQDDLYPVTFAALPWLWKINNEKAGLNLETLMFFSHVIYCAMISAGTGCYGQGPRGKYRGLSLKAQDHKFEWIPKDLHLTPEDLEKLAVLEEWFTSVMREMAEACLNAVSGDDNFAASALTKGYCCMHGCENAANLVGFWADGHTFEFIQREVSLDARDIALLSTLSTRLAGQNQQLADFIREFIGPDHHNPDQIELAFEP